MCTIHHTRRMTATITEVRGLPHRRPDYAMTARLLAASEATIPPDVRYALLSRRGHLSVLPVQRDAGGEESAELIRHILMPFFPPRFSGSRSLSGGRRWSWQEHDLVRVFAPPSPSPSVVELRARPR